MHILAILYRGGGYSHSIHKAKEVGPQSTKGVGNRDASDGFASELGGIMEVAMWLCAPLLH